MVLRLSAWAVGSALEEERMLGKAMRTRSPGRMAMRKGCTRIAVDIVAVERTAVVGSPEACALRELVARRVSSRIARLLPTICSASPRASLPVSATTHVCHQTYAAWCASPPHSAVACRSARTLDPPGHEHAGTAANLALRTPPSDPSCSKTSISSRSRAQTGRKSEAASRQLQRHLNQTEAHPKLRFVHAYRSARPGLVHIPQTRLYRQP